MPFEEVHFSSETNEWGTPQSFFDRLDAEFDFTLDAAAQDGNAKCPAYFTPEQDGLKQTWRGRVWNNPPYGRGVDKWVAKAARSAALHEAEVVVVLIFSRTCTKWWHDSAMQAHEIRFVKGRLRFDGSSPNAAPAPSAVLVFRPGPRPGNEPKVSTYYADPKESSRVHGGGILPL